MQYTMTSPCDACPFLIENGFTHARLEEFASGEFPCHKACNLNEDTGTYQARNSKTPHCAGALIFNEKRGQPHQMMRICERLKLYDPAGLNMDANVGEDPDDYREETPSERRRRTL